MTYPSEKMTIDQLNTTIIPKISLMVKIITKWRELRELKKREMVVLS